MIHLHNLNRLYKELQPALENIQDLVFKSGQVMLGEFTKEFEQRIANIAGVGYAAVVGSGSDALMYSLIAENISDKVAIPAQTYIATRNSVCRAGLEPVCVDVNADGLLNWDLIPNTVNFVVWVGLFGNVEVIQSDKFIIEDGAQHFGHALQGDVGSYSFDPTKNLPNFGNGGAVVSNNKDIIYRVKKLRRHGKHGYNIGGNSIMSERDCAEMLVKLDHFPLWQERRQEIAFQYEVHLGDFLRIVTNSNNICSKFVIDVDDRRGLQEHLTHRKIQTKRVYEHALADKDQANYNCANFLSLPIDPYMTDDELTEVILAIKEFFNELPFKGNL